MNRTLVMATIRDLREQGIRIMLDDFGTAYASMSYLRRFPFNGLKIDKSSIRDLCNDDITLATVQAILSLADRPNLSRWWRRASRPNANETYCVSFRCRVIQGFPDRPAGGQSAGERAAAAVVGWRRGDRAGRHAAPSGRVLTGPIADSPGGGAFLTSVSVRRQMMRTIRRS